MVSISISVSCSKSVNIDTKTITSKNRRNKMNTSTSMNMSSNSNSGSSNGDVVEVLAVVSLLELTLLKLVVNVAVIFLFSVFHFLPFIPKLRQAWLELILSSCRFYSLPSSGEKAIKSWSSRSNVNKPGQWVFRVGWPEMYGLNVQSADSYLPDIEQDKRIPNAFLVYQCKYISPLFDLIIEATVLYNF